MRMEYRPTGTCGRPRRIEEAGETDQPRRRHVSLTANGFTGQGGQARAVSVGLPVAVIKLQRLPRVGHSLDGHSSADRRADKAYLLLRDRDGDIRNNFATTSSSLKKNKKKLKFLVTLNLTSHT